MARIQLWMILISLAVSAGLVSAAGPRADSKTKRGEDLMNTALLLIDIQNDYFPGGKMELEGAVQAGSRAERLVSFFREKKLPLVHVQHISMQPGATFFLPGTEGMKIRADVTPGPDEKVVQKHYPNSFRGTSLLDDLKRMGVTKLVICGMMTHMCVDATTRAAFDHDFQCTVIGDACATRALSLGDKVIPAADVHGAFLAALNGVYAKVVATDDFISQHR
jgi:nicotinamidase-related amidase